MPHATADHGVKLYYEETGSGVPVIFVHEFAGDLRSWEPQLRHFGQRHRAIAYNARGYPPSDVPPDAASYSQNRAADDVAAVLDHLRVGVAHVVGLSMAAFADRYAHGPTRVQFENKDPRGFAEFKRALAEHDATGSANTQLGVQRERPSLWDLTGEMQALRAPTLVLTGDEDWPCLLPGILMKENIPSAALAVMPNCGHGINLENPDQFNRIVGDFLAQVDAGRWPERDPRARAETITGMR